jgi:hypothetical protein
MATGQLSDVIRHLRRAALRQGKVQEASRAVEDIKDGVQKAAVLRAVAAVQARAGDFKAAHKTADAIGDGDPEKMEALLDMAALRLRKGDRDSAAKLYREAIQTIQAHNTPLDLLWDDGEMCAPPWRLHRIVSARAEAGDAEGALAWADKQELAFVRALALAGIAEHIGKRMDQQKPPADKK